MEKGHTPDPNSIFPLHRSLEDHRRGLLNFEELRKAFVDWSLHVLESTTPEGNKLVSTNLMLTIPEE